MAEKIAKSALCIIRNKAVDCYLSEILPNFNRIHILECDWQQLKNKNILNKNVLVNNFGYIHRFNNPPIFPNASKIFLLYNHKYFHYYWINRKIFPNNPVIYLYGHPCDPLIFIYGFKFYFVDTYFYTAMRYANEIGADTSLINKISSDDYFSMLNDHQIEDVKMEDYQTENNKPFDEIDINDIIRNNDKISQSILEKSGWNK